MSRCPLVAAALVVLATATSCDAPDPATLPELELLPEVAATAATAVDTREVRPRPDLAFRPRVVGPTGAAAGGCGGTGEGTAAGTAAGTGNCGGDCAGDCGSAHAARDARGPTGRTGALDPTLAGPRPRGSCGGR